MEITNELLAAYAEGNVTPEERKAVREYLTEHPSQLGAAFIPSYSHISFDKMAASTCADSASFDDRLGDLLDEII